MSENPVIIIGASHAGSELAAALCKLDPGRSVILIGDEPYLPYHRPPLSKAWLAGDSDVSAINIRPRTAYEASGIEVMTGTRVDSIDRATKHVALSDGRRLEYSFLALTTGARVRRMSCPGSEAAERSSNFHYLRTADDVLRLRPQLVPGGRIVIVGGGYIGLELASAATKRGMSVTVVESEPRVLSRVTAPAVSEFYEKVHRAHGVDLRTGTTVAGFAVDEDNGRVMSVLVKTGEGEAEGIDADIVVVGIGVVPNVELAAAAGLEVANGIVVDEYARTSDPAVVSAGDCTSHPSPYGDGLIRLESVPNALDQARAAAATICGQSRPHTAFPWFWSDQFELKLQMLGLSRGYDQAVIRGDPAENSFSAFYLKNGRVIAADTINRMKDFVAAKKLVAIRALAAADELQDETLDLTSLLEPRMGVQHG